MGFSPPRRDGDSGKRWAEVHPTPSSQNYAWLLTILLLSTSVQARAEPSLFTLYTLHCSGCHGADGHGVPDKGIPDLHQSGSYVGIPAGRSYLVQVPGLSQSRLDDATAARLLNYVLHRFSADQLPAGFKPYTPAEVTTLRADKASDAETRRQTILGALNKAYTQTP